MYTYNEKWVILSITLPEKTPVCILSILHDFEIRTLVLRAAACMQKLLYQKTSFEKTVECVTKGVSLLVWCVHNYHGSPIKQGCSGYIQTVQISSTEMQ